MMNNRAPISRDLYEDYPPRPKERKINTYKILCVANLNNKINDTDIRDALFRQFMKFGDVSVKVCHDGSERFAYIYFRSYDEAREARHAKSKLVLFDKMLDIEPIYERTMPSTSRRRSTTPDYGPPMPQNQRTVNLRNAPMNNSPPAQHQMQNRRMPHQQMMNKPHHQNNYQNNYQRNYNPMNNHHQQDHHQNNYNPNYQNQRMNHYNNNNNMHNNNNHHMRNNDYHNPNQQNNHNNNHHHNNNNQNQNQPNQMRPQQRESKKDKFPNYLHHIPPEDDDKATRTLFVGNLEVTISDQDLKRIFEKYGSVEDIDVKRPPPGQGNAYAFIKFLNLDMAHRCKVEMSGQYIGKFQCKIGYGKCTPTTRIWVGGLGTWTSLSTLEREFDRFGAIRKIDFVKGDNHAYIQYDSIDAAQAACQEMRGYPLGGPERRLRVDFADPEPYNYNIPGARPADQVNFPSSDSTTGGTQSIDNASASIAKNGDSNFNNSANNPTQRFNNNRTSAEFTNESFSNTNEEWVNEDADTEQINKRDVWSSDNSTVQIGTSPRNPNQVKRPRTSDQNDLNLAKKPKPASLDDNDETDVINQRSNLVISENVSTIPELVKCCPVAWNGGLILKSMVFPARMLLCNGDISLVDLLMKDTNETPVLKITQRLRLDPVRLEDVSKRIQTAGSFGYCLLLTTVGSNTMQFATNNDDGSTLQTRPLRNLVSYLKQKEAAGVVSLNSTKDGQETLGVLYVFPPCTYATDLLKKVAPNLVTDSTKDTKEEYLVIAVVKG